MDESKKAKLEEAGVNVDVVLNRFLDNEKLMMSFLLTFFQDPNFGVFQSAMEENRYEDAFKALHTLKGLCGNLAIDSLYDLLNDEVELLRCKKTEEAQQLLPKVVEEYNRVINILATVEK